MRLNVPMSVGPDDTHPRAQNNIRRTESEEQILRHTQDEEVNCKRLHGFSADRFCLINLVASYKSDSISGQRKSN